MNFASIFDAVLERVAGSLVSDALHSSFGRREGLNPFCQHEIVFYLVKWRRHDFAGRRLTLRLFDEINDQRLLYGIDHVVLDILIAFLKEVRDKAMVARRRDREMNMGRPHMADVGSFHELPDGSVHRDGVGDWRDRPDYIAAVGLRAVEATHPRPFHIALVLVKAFAVGLPQIEHRPRDWLAV